jgi:hypothetical protein
VIIQPIFEGQGDESALPILLRRLGELAGVWDLEVAKPHRRNRTHLVQKDSLRRHVRVAALRPNCSGILIVLDADDDCPRVLAPTLAIWAREAAAGIPCEIVMANREYEAWFLASIEALRGRAGILPDAVSHPDPEAPRDAKGELERRMHPKVSYLPAVDQARLTALIVLETAFQRCRSFRKLARAFGALAGIPPENWPPAAWTQ